MTIAYYETLQDGGTSISTDTSSRYRGYEPRFELKFDPPNDIVIDEHRLNRLILCYRVYTNAEETNVELIARINNIDIGARPRRLRGSVPQSFQEIVNWNCNIQRGENEVSFEVKTGGIGYVSVSDIIIWYKRS